MERAEFLHLLHLIGWSGRTVARRTRISHISVQRWGIDTDVPVEIQNWLFKTADYFTDNPVPVVFDRRRKAYKSNPEPLTINTEGS
jgi:hypothetical protein